MRAIVPVRCLVGENNTRRCRYWLDIDEKINKTHVQLERLRLVWLPRNVECIKMFVWRPESWL